METILIATDFSPVAENAADYGVELTKFFDGRIVLTHAYPLPVMNYEMGYSYELLNSLQESAMDKLYELKRKLIEKHGSIDIECVAEVGPPATVIEEAANRHDADLIVMGVMSEAGKLKENLIGSTALTVAKYVTTPVFIIPEDVKYRRIRKISFACDLDRTEETDQVYVAKFFSKVFDAELEIVNVESLHEEMTLEKATTSLFVEKKLENVKHKTTHITGENIATELEDYFKTFRTDLIMVSPKKHNMFYNLFHQSITKDLAFHSHTPILAIH